MENNEIGTVTRFSPEIENGLSEKQVEERKKQHLTNKTKIAVGKSYWEIIRSNVLSLFNIMLFSIAALMIIAQKYDSLFFLLVIIPNICVGLYEDIKARILLKRLRLLTQPKCDVIRNSVLTTINIDEIVLDDIMVFTSGKQVCADGYVKKGKMLVNESQLTGEPDNIEKNVGDIVYSGSFVVSGKAYVIAEKIGKDAYIESIQEKANKFSRSPSIILKSLKFLFKILSIVVVIFTILTITMYACRGSFNSYEGFQKVIGPMAGSLIGMIPSGLYLLTSAALAVTVIALSKKKAQVQDFYSIEMLSRCDTLCLDKTGTITDGTMIVDEVIDLRGNKFDINQIISDLLIATEDNNLTAIALRKQFNLEAKNKAIKTLPFNSDTKFSAATFNNNETYVLGSIENINFKDKEQLIILSRKYTKNGLRVLGLGKLIDGEINNDLLIGDVKSIGLIVLQDHVKEDAIETFKWFKNNGINIKVISGDNAESVSYIANKVGIENADKYISLENLSNEEIKENADKYTVFGRVSPEQKEVLILALKEKGHTVSMTGDGVNDILALKRSDCSIAMASGADSARNVSHIVLLDSKFEHLPQVVEEGRRVVNNVQRSSSLFLTKTIFSIFFTLWFLISALFNHETYPFDTNHFYLWEIFSIGICSFFLALEPNKEKVSGNFFKNILSRVIPGAVLFILPVAILFVLFYFNKFGLINVGLGGDNGFDITRSLASLTMGLLSLVFLFKTCFPFSKYRLIVFIGDAVCLSGLIAFFVCQTIVFGQPNLLHISFEKFTIQHLLLILIIIIFSSAVFLLVNYLINHRKKD